MRAMGADRKLKLHQEFIGCLPERVLRPSILATHLAELARPICQDRGLAFIDKGRIVGMLGPVVAHAGKPAPAELIISGKVVSERTLSTAGLATAAPDEFRAADKGVVDRAL